MTARPTRPSGWLWRVACAIKRALGFHRDGAQQAHPECVQGELVVSADEFAQVRECLGNPHRPSKAAIEGAEILRRLPTPSHQKRPPGPGTLAGRGR